MFIKWLLFHKARQNKPYEGKYYVILIQDGRYMKAEIWINVDLIFNRPPQQGACFRYDLHRNRKPVHCTVMAICDTEAEARNIANNLYV